MKNPLAPSKTAPSLDHLANDVLRLEGEVAKAEADHKEAFAALEAPAEDADPEKIVREEAIAKVRAAQLRQGLARAREALSSAQADADERARVEAHAAACALSAKAAAEVPRLYAQATQKVRSVLRILAEASLATMQVNGNLPAGAERLASPEDLLRGPHVLPREVIATRRITRALHPATRDPLTEEQEARATYDARSGKGHLQTQGNPPYTMEIVECAEFDQVTFLPARSLGSFVPFAQINLPPLRTGGAPGWAPLETRDARGILAALDRLEGASDEPPADARVPEIELIRVRKHKTVDELHADEEAARKLAAPAQNTGGAVTRMAASIRAVLG